MMLRRRLAERNTFNALLAGYIQVEAITTNQEQTMFSARLIFDQKSFQYQRNLFRLIVLNVVAKALVHVTLIGNQHQDWRLDFARGDVMKGNDDRRSILPLPLDFEF
jgi:hypothetical protein